MQDELTKLVNRDVEPRQADQAERARLELIRAVAARVMAKEYGGPRGDADTPDLTAVTQDAWMRLEKRAVWENRAHFLGAAANATRQILIDAARRRSVKRRHRDALEYRAESHAMQRVPPVKLDELLQELQREDPLAARVAGYRLFGDLRYEVIAECEGKSVRSVERAWRFAKAWLAARIERDA